MGKKISLLLSVFSVLLLNLLCFAAENHVIVKRIDWKVYEAGNFDIYYYEDSKPWLSFAAKTLNKAYKKQAYSLNPSLNKHIPFFLFASINDMQQNSIAYVSDGVGGLTEPYKDRFMAYSDGSKQWLDNVITHEFGHEIEFSVMVDGFWKSARILKTYVYPLWIMEGLSEYVTENADMAVENMYVRDAVLDGKLPSLVRLYGFSHLKPHQTTLAYKTSGAAIRFLAEEYGKDKPALLLDNYKSKYDINSVLEPLIGMDIFAFDKKFADYQKIKYELEAADKKLEDPNENFSVLTNQPDGIFDFNLSPVYSLKRGELAYLSTKKGSTAVLVIENISKKKKTILDYSDMGIENIPYSRFTKPVRSLNMSLDERYIVFSAQKNHYEYICIYDAQKRKFAKFKMEGFIEARQFSFSLSSQKIVFIGMKNGINDIYEMSFDKEKGIPLIETAENLTNSFEDELSPFYLSEDEIVFSAEKEGNGGIYRTIDLLRKNKETETIFSSSASVYDFAYDSGYIYFTSDENDIFSLYRYSLHTKKTETVFSPLGGIFSPFIKGDKLFFSYFRHSSVNIYSREMNKLDFTQYIPVEKTDTTSERIDYDIPGSTKAYKSRFSNDLFFPALMFSSPGGLFWMNYASFSDMLGYHNLAFYINYNSAYPFLNYSADYLYSRYRTKFFAQNSYYSLDDTETSEGFEYDRRYLRNITGISYPFDRYNRFEAYLMQKDDFKNYKTPFKAKFKNYTRALSLGYIKDDVNGLYLSAVYGQRISFSWTNAAEIAGGNVKYDLYEAEALKYLPISRKSAFVNRFYAGYSGGRDRRNFDFGGINGLRGFSRGSIENENSRVLNYNGEIRLYLTDMDYYMWYMFPDFYFKALYLKVFSDNAYGWDYKRELDNFSVSKIKNSVGIGFNLHSFILQKFQMVLSFDWAIRTDNGSEIFYFYLGPLF